MDIKLIKSDQLNFEYDDDLLYFILEQAEVRLEGKEHNKKRPYLGFKADINSTIILLKPKIKKSPDGWALSGSIDIKIEIGIAVDGVIKRKLTSEYLLSCKAKGFAVVRRWYKNVDLSHQLKNILIEFLRVLSIDPIKYINLLMVDNCNMCGRLLTDDKSQAIGIGPECIKSFYHVIDVILPDSNRSDVLTDIKQLRKAMFTAHPDRGGDADVFIKLKEQLNALKKQRT